MTTIFNNNTTLMEWMEETVVMRSNSPDYEAYIILSAEDDVQLHRAILAQRIEWGADTKAAESALKSALWRQQVQLEGIQRRKAHGPLPF